MAISTSERKRADIDVYTTFVDSLFAGRRHIIYGCILQVVITLLLWRGTGEPLVGMLGFVLIALGAIRFWQAVAYKRQAVAYEGLLNDDHLAFARRWENLSTLSCTAAGLAVGLVVAISLHVSADQFVSIASFALLFAGFPTIVGRLYGSLQLSTFMTIAMLAPVSIGLFFRFDTAHLVLAIMALPYGALVVNIVRAVRIPVARAVRRRHDVEVMANEFDAAVNAMPSGLLMLDEHGRVIVINEPAVDILALPEDFNAKGRHIDVVVRHAFRSDKNRFETEAGLSSIFDGIREGRRLRNKLRLPDGRSLQFTVSADELAKTVVLIEDISDRQRSMDKIKRLARFDPLTELANRAHFATIVKQRIRNASGREAALVLFDLDDFKHINDSLGHQRGDLLLAAVADKVRSYQAGRWFAGRHGGDEFLLFATGEWSEAELQRDIDELVALIGDVYDVDGEAIRTSASMGMYHCAIDAFELSEALRRADIALYQTKKNGKAGGCLFRAEMECAYYERQHLKDALLDALDRKTLDVLYQPIIALSDQRVYAAEALCRWTKDDGQTVSPGIFVPLAEEIGVVSRLTEFVIDRATQDVSTWTNDIKVSINLSAIDFSNLDIAEVLTQACERHGVDPKRIDVEITETAVIRNRKVMEGQIERIRALGCGVSLDDFGTGQSSLSYLDSLPLDTIKMDRSFVVGIETEQRKLDLLTSVVNLCHSLGKEVVVEGVETLEQLKLANDIVGADRVQGWVYAPALPASAVAEFNIARKGVGPRLVKSA